MAATAAAQTWPLLGRALSSGRQGKQLVLCLSRRPRHPLITEPRRPQQNGLRRLVTHGVNTVTTLIEKKKAQLVIIANDMDLIEVRLLLVFSLSMM